MNKLFLSNEAISIAVRDVFKFYHNFRCKVSFKQVLFYELFVICIIIPFRTCCMKYFTKSFSY